MKAVWYEKIGAAADVLNVGKFDDPSPKSGEVLIEVKSSGINPSDVKIRAGARGDLQFPKIIPHSDGGGVIVEVGKNVDPKRVGERVWIWNGAFGRSHGTCAELISIPEKQAVKMNNDTNYEAAACLGIPASTAYYGIFANGTVEDKTILVTGGSGAVGYYGIQFAKWAGAKVISTVSSDQKAEIAKNAGADLVLNYKKDRIAQAVKEYTKGTGVDRVLEVEFGGNISINQEIVKDNGVIAAYASAGKMEPILPFYNLMFKGIKIDTYLIYSISDNDRKKVVNGISNALSQDAIDHMIAKSYSFDEIVSAHEALESGTVVGNILVDV